MADEKKTGGPKQFKCGSCGAYAEFHPGSMAQKCPYCGAETAIPQSEEEVEELDFHSFLQHAEEDAETEELRTVKCEACGSEPTMEENVSSSECPYCGSKLVVEGGSHKVLKPKSLLPFKIDRREATQKFRDWVGSLWFAPSDLKKRVALQAALNGLYVPYWTYDCDTMSYYRGERGDEYEEEEEYETTDSEGNKETKTRTVVKVRWTRVSGTVWRDFDDVLILASESLPRKYADALEPWDLENLEPYQDEFLSGFRTETYQVDLASGFDRAKEIMDNRIRDDVEDDIGGDRQRIHSVRTRHDDITFKHILLPVWLAAYRYGDQPYRFLVNARTGEVQGERPWSWVKIGLAVAAGLAVVGGIVYLMAGA